MQTIHVNLAERSYDIQIGTGNLDRIGDFACRLARVTHAAVITDENVQQHAEAVAEQIAQAGATVDLLVVEPGEQSKSIETAALLWEQMLALGADRKTLVVPVGGGVVGDLAGFVAATFARGIAMLQVPTSLLAQVDSSVGGKVGINLPEAKNMVGAFWQPLGVLIDTAVLETLPEREYRAGLGEVVKYGVILDAELFEYLEQNLAGLNERQDDVLTEVVARCCRLKADVVEADERETTGRRAVLNYGHTFGHAIETVTGYGEYLHGEAISIGMLCASRLAAALGRIEPEVTHRQRDLLLGLGLPVEVPQADVDQLVAAMRHDKKVEHGQLRFVLPTRLGHVELVDQIEPEQARAAFKSTDP